MSSSGSASAAAIACVLLGVVLVMPAMRAGFFADDYLQIAQLERWSRSPARPLDLSSFVPRDRALVQRLRDDGTLPFFAAPGLSVTFVRPLSSALMWLDHSLFGRWAAGYHLDSIRFDGSLDDPALVFLIPSRGDLRRLVIPPIGGEISIPRPLPFGSPRPGDGGSAGTRPG